MKLNSSGFAITTMVYGLILLASLILFLTLSIMNATSSDNYKFSEDVEQKLIWCDYTYDYNTKTCRLTEK